MSVGTDNYNFSKYDDEEIIDDGDSHEQRQRTREPNMNNLYSQNAYNFDDDVSDTLRNHVFDERQMKVCM